MTILGQGYVKPRRLIVVKLPWLWLRVPHVFILIIWTKCLGPDLPFFCTSSSLKTLFRDTVLINVIHQITCLDIAVTLAKIMPLMCGDDTLMIVPNQNKVAKALSYCVKIQHSQLSRFTGCFLASYNAAVKLNEITDFPGFGTVFPVNSDINNIPVRSLTPVREPYYIESSEGVLVLAKPEDQPCFDPLDFD